MMPIGEVVRYETEDDGSVVAIVELRDGDRVRVLVMDSNGDVQW